MIVFEKEMGVLILIIAAAIEMRAFTGAQYFSIGVITGRSFNASVAGLSLPLRFILRLRDNVNNF